MEQPPAPAMTLPTPSSPPSPPVSSEPEAPSSIVDAPHAEQTDGLSPTLPASPAETIRAVPDGAHQAVDPSSDGGPLQQTASERGFQYGLNRGNLEQEVGQVIGTLGSWWGGVKKQSASALSSFKADLDKTVLQAQADLETLRNAKVEVVRKDSAQYEAEKAAERERREEEARLDGKQAKGKGKEVRPTGITPEEANPGLPQTASALLSRLSSSTSQLQHTLQSSLQSGLASASTNQALRNPAQFAEHLRHSSASENLQSSMKQAERIAEEYLRKGDQWRKDAEKWMEEAIKVVPPDGDEAAVVGMSWDGSDFYSFSTSISPAPDNLTDNVLFDASTRTPRSSMSGAALAVSRKDVLLRRLREDKELLLVDPEGDRETPERRHDFRLWVTNNWTKEQTEEYGEEGEHAGGIRMALVPEHLTDEQFWQRYFFHKHMIEKEEEKRKRLLQATQEAQADDFSWDDDAEDPNANASASAAHVEHEVPATSPSIATSKPEDDIHVTPASTNPLIKAEVSTSTSPRDSEESYDLVSDQGGKLVKPISQAVDDEDSDWE